MLRLNIQSVTSMIHSPRPTHVLLLLMAIGMMACGHTEPPAAQTATSAAAANSDAAASPAPAVSVTDQAACTSLQSPYRDFDFWLGNWDVYDASNNDKVGVNSISKLAGGCLLLEQWQGVLGTTGTSMNFYDPLQAAWRQVWQSEGVFIDYQGALDDRGTMRLQGTISYHKTGKTAPFRGSWQRQKDGSVLQILEQMHAETGQWSSWFSGSYRRQQEPEQAQP